MKRLELTEKYFEGSGNTSKLLIMVTDGEDHSEACQRCCRASTLIN